MSNIITKRIEQIFEIRNDNETIEVCIHSSGKVSLYNNAGDNEFVFLNSDPDRLKRMAQLFLEAANLAKDYEN